jgi:hypothetical protein
MILRSTSIVLAVERKLITNIIGVMKILVIKCKLGPFAWDQHNRGHVSQVGEERPWKNSTIIFLLFSINFSHLVLILPIDWPRVNILHFLSTFQ